MGEAGGRKHRARAAAVVLVLVSLAGAMAANAAQVVDQVVAVAAGTVIMMSDVRAALTLGLFDPGAAKDPVEAVMRWLIDRQLVLDEAARGERVEVDPLDVDSALSRARQRFASDTDYRRALDGVGLDEAGARRFVADTLTVRRFTEQRFDAVPPPGDEELRAYYASHAGRFVRNGRQLGFDEAFADVMAALQQEHRDQAVSAWMDRIRRRADIREVYRSSR